MKQEESQVIVSSSRFKISEPFLEKLASATKTKKKVTAAIGKPNDSFFNEAHLLSEGLFFTFQFTEKYFNTIFSTIYHDIYIDKLLKHLNQFFSLGTKYRETVPQDMIGNSSFVQLKMELKDIGMTFMVPTFSQEENFLVCIRSAFEYVGSYLAPTSRRIIKNQIKVAFKVEGINRIFLEYIETTNQWRIIDLLDVAINVITEHYNKGKFDVRSSKPDIYLNGANFKNHLNMGNNWVIKTPDGSFFMNKPNDVALYVSICDKNVVLAKALRKKILYRNDTMTEFVHDTMLPSYYDFFEHTITAIIASYTAVECFVNICIDPDFKYLEKDETGSVLKIITKAGIERGFNLEKKITKVLPQSLGTPSPNKEKWWNKFKDLEKIRNEIIHSKESKSADRYASFLSADIYTLIDTHRDLISYYCKALLSGKNEIQSKLPYGFGSDILIPSVLTHDSYMDMIRSIYRPDPNFNK